MNRTLLVVIGVVIVVLIGIGLWMYSGGTGGGAAVGTTDTTTTQIENTNLQGLLASASPQRCSFSTSAGGSDSSGGVVYVSNGEMRGDFTSTSASQSTESHMIVKGGVSYVWSDALPQGIKMSFESMGAQGNQATEWFDPSVSVDYSCDPWSVDVNMFVVPTNIEFQDLNALVPQGV